MTQIPPGQITHAGTDIGFTWMHEGDRVDVVVDSASLTITWAGCFSGQWVSGGSEGLSRNSILVFLRITNLSYLHAPGL